MAVIWLKRGLIVRNSTVYMCAGLPASRILSVMAHVVYLGECGSQAQQAISFRSPPCSSGPVDEVCSLDLNLNLSLARAAPSLYSPSFALCPRPFPDRDTVLRERERERD